MSIEKHIKGKGILAKLIETALILWIKKQCEEVNNLILKVKGSNINLLKGNISEIRLIASGILFKEIPIQDINISSSEIHFNLSLKDKSINFKENLKVSADISITRDGFTKILIESRWAFLGELIQKEFLNMRSINYISLKNGNIQICSSEDRKTTTTSINTFKLICREGKPELIDIKSSKSIEIPMDQNIFCKNTKISDNLLKIKLEAIITT